MSKGAARFVMRRGLERLMTRRRVPPDLLSLGRGREERKRWKGEWPPM